MKTSEHNNKDHEREPSLDKESEQNETSEEVYT